MAKDIVEVFLGAIDREKEYQASAPAHSGVQKGSGVATAIWAWKGSDYGMSWVQEQQTKHRVVGLTQDDDVLATINDACNSCCNGHVAGRRRKEVREVGCQVKMASSPCDFILRAWRKSDFTKDRTPYGLAAEGVRAHASRKPPDSRDPEREAPYVVITIVPSGARGD